LLVKLFDRGVSSDGSISEWVIVCVLVLLLGSAFVTEIIGVHAIFGAFLAGLAIPRKHGFEIALTEKIEDIVTILLLPIYFAYSGLRTNVQSC
jgi:Kef-type K+ transport system membrane component KefB